MKESNLYLIRRSDTDHIDYDEYDSFVVCASTPEEAVRIHPAYRKGNPDSCNYIYSDGSWYAIYIDGEVGSEPAYRSGWTSDIESLSIVYIGQADSDRLIGHVLCSSFNAG